MKKMILVFTLYFSVSAAALTRLDQGTGSMVNLPTYNQGALGTCYAYSLSNLIDAARNVTSENTRTFLSSPLMAAYDYTYDIYQATVRKYGEKDNGFRGSIYSGDVTEAFASMRRHGICNHLVMKDTFMDERQYLESPNPTSGLISPLISLYKEGKKKDSKTIASYIYKYLLFNKFDSNSLPSVDNIQRLITESKGSFLFLNSMFSEMCTSSRRPMPSAITGISRILLNNGTYRQGLFNRSRKDVARQIVKRLQEPNAQPQGIEMCSAVIKNRRYRKGQSQTPCGLHALLIVGEQTIGERTFFLLQNSWGSSCKDLSMCEAGKFWIDYEDLLANSSAWFWLNLKK